MENTLENKAKFFAQYWGQKVLRYTRETIHPFVDCNVLDFTRNNIKHAFLELKPLSSITDEHAIEVAKICIDPKEKPLEILEIQNWDWCCNIIVNKNKGEFLYLNKPCEVNMHISILFDRPDIKWVWDYNHEKGQASQEKHCPRSIDAYDYLRSKSYALPYMGLSVEELIEYGWVRLQ